MQCAKLIGHDCTRQRLEGFCLDRRLVNWALAATPPHDPLQISGQSASLPKMPAQRRAIPVPGSLSRKSGTGRGLHKVFESTGHECRVRDEAWSCWETAQRGGAVGTFAK